MPTSPSMSPLDYAKQLHSFVERHGRFPRSRATEASEVRLERWLTSYRRRGKSERKKQAGVLAALSYLDESVPGWREPQVKWAVFVERAGALKRFVEQGGRLPVQNAASDPVEREAGQFLRNQLALLSQPSRMTPFSGARLAHLDREVPRWRDGATRPQGQRAVVSFEQRVMELEGFIAEHGRQPSCGAQGGRERSMANFLVTQRQAVRGKGTSVMTPRRQQLLNEKVPGWEEPDSQQSPERRLAQFEAFVMKHRRAPSRHAEDQHERQLSNWRGVGGGKPHMRPRVQRALQQAGVPQLTERRSPQQFIADLEAFATTHRRRPSRASEALAERSLYAWYARTGCNPELRARADDALCRAGVEPARRRGAA